MSNRTKILKLGSVMLVLMTFVLSLTYTVDFHYCQGELKSFSFYGKAKNCHEVTDEPPSCHLKCTGASDSKCSKSDYSCCNNRTVSFESDFAEKIFVHSFSSYIPHVVVANAHSPFDIFMKIQEDFVPFVYYIPH